MNRFQTWYRMQPRALRAILTINVVVYVLWLLLLRHFRDVFLFVWGHLALNPGLPGILLEPWQLVSYSFLHLGTDFWGLLHITFNMLWLVWIGREYEELHGAHRLLALYLFGAVGGALLTVLLNAVFPGVGAFGGPVHGASGAVLGVLTAVAILYPYKSVALLFFGVVRLLYVVIGFLVIDLLFMGGGSASVSTHMGGALFGFLYAKAAQNGMDLSGWARIFFREPRSRRGRTVRKKEEGVLNQIEGWLASRTTRKSGRPAGGPGYSTTTTTATVSNVTVAETDVDRILDKISAHGYEALSEDEKRILYEASRR